MSKGSQIVPVRIPLPMLVDMDQQIEKRNATARGEPWTVSEFIRSAIADKLAKMGRSRAASGKRLAARLAKMRTKEPI